MKYFSPTCAETVDFSVQRCNGTLAILFLLFVVVTAWAAPVFAQEATIVGSVTDPTGSVVPNVTITVTLTSSGQVRSLKTNEAGQYVAPDLNIGNYMVRAEATGFKAAEKKDVVLNVNDRTRIDFVMQVGSVRESVTVEANAVAVQSDSGDVSSVITGQQVTELATNERSLYNLYALTPGASSIQGMGMMRRTRCCKSANYTHSSRVPGSPTSGRDRWLYLLQANRR